MPVAGPFPDAVNQTGFIDMFQYANTVTGDLFVGMLLISVYLVPFLYLLLRGEKFESAAIVAGFMATITAVLLRVSEILIVDKYLWFCIASLIIPVVIIWVRDPSS